VITKFIAIRLGPAILGDQENAAGKN